MPFMIGNAELEGNPDIGEYCLCPNPRCKKVHKVEYGKRMVGGEMIPSKVLAYVNCGKKKYLVGINGKHI